MLCLWEHSSMGRINGTTNELKKMQNIMDDSHNYSYTTELYINYYNNSPSQGNDIHTNMA